MSRLVNRWAQKQSLRTPMPPRSARRVAVSAKDNDRALAFEAWHAGLLHAVNSEAGNSSQSCQEMRRKSSFLRLHNVQPDAAQQVEGLAECRDSHNVGLTRGPDPLPCLRRKIQQPLADEEGAAAEGRADFVRGQGEDVDGRANHVGGAVSDQLGRVHQQECTIAMGQPPERTEVVESAQDVGGPADGDQANTYVAMSVLHIVGPEEILQVNEALPVHVNAYQRKVLSLAPGQLVGVVLQQRVNHHGLRPRFVVKIEVPGDEVQRLGGVGGEDEVVGLARRA